VTSGFPVRVRGQIEAAVRDAAARPDDAGASGRLGMALHTYQELDLAEICYRRAHLLDPKAFEWAYYLTVVEQIHGETQQAIADARAAVQLDPASKPARMRLAEALLQGKEFGQSRKLYEKLVAEEPDLALYHYGLGKALAAQGSLPEAIAQYHRACELSPVFSAARYALAMAYRQSKDIGQASRQLAIYQRNPSGSPPEDSWMAQITALNQGGLIRAQAAQQYLAQGRPAVPPFHLIEDAVKPGWKASRSTSRSIRLVWKNALIFGFAGQIDICRTPRADNSPDTPCQR
jgi:tetratricopeptide (TPR) repeat protein